MRTNKVQGSKVIQALDTAKRVSDDHFAETGRHFDVQSTRPFTVLSVGTIDWYRVRITDYFPTPTTTEWWATTEINGEVMMSQDVEECIHLSTRVN